MSSPVRTTCNRDCPDSCGILATVEGGRITAHRGDPEHGITRGFLCRRGNRYLNRFYAEDRLLHPVRRTKSGHEPIAWDDALDLVADNLRRVRDELDPRAVLAVSYSGIKGAVARSLWRLFWGHFGGCTSTEGGLSVEATIAAQEHDFGAVGTHAPEDLEHAKALVVWGKNIFVTRPHTWQFARMARKRGAPLHVIDPVTSATAARADEHYAIRPGSDAALALGVAKLLLERDQYDHEFVGAHTHGFETFRDLVLAHDLDQLATVCDLPRARIEQLAEVYVSIRPLATLIGLGPSYWCHGGETVRLIDSLAVLSGNLGLSGGGAHTDLEGAPGLDFSFLKSAPRGKTRKLLLPRLGDEILAAIDPPLRAGLVAGANPAATAPHTARVREAFASLDFLAVIEQFMTATAREADVVLPCTTYLEMEDLVCAYGHHWIGLDREVVPPRGECRSDVVILQGLAERLGFGDALAGSSAAWMRRILAPLAPHGVTLESLEAGAQRNPLAVDIPFADRRFPTASGKVEFLTELSPLPCFPTDDRLRLLATKSRDFVNAQVNDEDLVAEACVRVHPATAAARALGEGDLVRVRSEVASVRARLALDETVRPDVLFFNPARWRGDLQGVNQLREATLADLGGAAAMHETLVRLERAEA